MNREIKFRAWDEGKKVMHNDFQFIKSGNESNDWIVFSSNINPYGTDNNVFDNPYFQQQLKVMQFTGLQDKNGKEIYEGDIMKWNSTSNITVVFLKGAFGATFKSTDESINFWVNLSILEIIGNIYENPELLKD